MFDTLMLIAHGLLIAGSLTLSILRICGFAINPVIGVALAAASFIPLVIVY